MSERIIPPNKQPESNKDYQYVLTYTVEGSTGKQRWVFYAPNYSEANDIANEFLAKNPRRRYYSLTQSKYKVVVNLIVLCLVAGSLHWLFPNLFSNIFNYFFS